MNETPVTSSSDADHSVRGTRYSALARVLRLARKELREILRDRRTIVTLIAMPLLLYPLMSVVFLQFSLATQLAPKGEPAYRVGVMTRGERDTFLHRLEVGKRALGDSKPKDPMSKQKPRIAPKIDVMRDQESPEPRSDQERADAMENLTLMLQGGVIDLIVVIPKLDDAGAGRWLPCQVFSVSNSANARDALAYIEVLLAAANEADLKARLDARADLPPVTLLSLQRIMVDAPSADGMISLSALVPLILILMTITGAVYPAIDLTAGERERGTLEILIAAPVPRFELLTAKYISVVTVAVLNAVVNLVCMTITVKWSGVSALLPGLQELSPVLLLEIFALLLLFAAFFSAVLLCLTSFARSFKEAQAYLIPLMLASLAPGIMAMMPGLKLDGVLTVLPLVNIVLMARDLFDTGVDPVHGTIVVLTTLLYALAALSLAARVFGAESVLYSEQSSWADLLRRPETPQRAASIAAMLWCLALMLPMQFGLVALLRSLGALPVIVSILLQVAVNLILFGFLPAFFVFLGRIEIRPALGLSMPRPAGMLAGFLLGLSLWPLELWLLAHAIDAKLFEEHFGTVLQGIKQARESIGWGVLAIAVVPAILEEIYFRGLLFQALKARCGAFVTIGVSGMLFGITHVVLGGAIGLERFIPSAVLGLILGVVCWRSGSLWPSMIQHICHNAILLSVGAEDIPWEWLAAGTLGTTLGGLLLWQAGRKKPSLPLAA